MSELARPEAGEPLQRMPNPAELYPRSATPTQPAGAREPLPPQNVERTLQPVPAPTVRAPQPTPGKKVAGAPQPSGFQRAMDAARVVMPLVQKLLPLLEGNVASAVSNVLAPRSQTSHAANLEPIESALVKMHLEQRAMHNKLEEQNSSLQRVADQLGQVKEATDRNTLEQQELMDDLHRMRRKFMIYAWVGLCLLVAAIAANVFVFLRIQRILP